MSRQHRLEEIAYGTNYSYVLRSPNCWFTYVVNVGSTEYFRVSDNPKNHVFHELDECRDPSCRQQPYDTKHWEYFPITD